MAPSIFFQGSLDDGITIAVQQNKTVLCFATDEGEESSLWENDFLADEALIDVIGRDGLALRLVVGSQEADYLMQIYPMPRIPTVVLIKNNRMRDYIAPGIDKDAFVRRVLDAFKETPIPPPSSSTSAAQAETAPASTAQAESVDSQAVPTDSRRSTTSFEHEESERSESVARVLAERAAKLKARKEEAERKAKEERAQAKQKAKAEAEAGVDTDAARSHKQAELLKKRQQQELEERRRILKRIEDDKAERRMRAAEREQARVDSQVGGDMTAAAAAAVAVAPKNKVSKLSLSEWGSRTLDTTAVQVRLFDGSTLRWRLLTTEPLSEVRKLVDAERLDGGSPYSFKQVLIPLPNKNIDETEEGKSLGELGLSPSATLVLVPVKKYVAAYDERPQSAASRFIGFIMGIFAWFLGLFGLGGRRGAAASATTEAQDDDATSQGAGNRIRGFENREDRHRDQQLYNGNSLNFEPRPDEDGK